MLTRGGKRGIKRKMSDDGECGTGDDDDEILYFHNRESVFNISVCKLKRFRQIADPSLRRSVLVCNTLRTIEEEMESEGIHRSTVPATAGFFPAIQTDENMTLDSLPPPLQATTTAGPTCYPISPQFLPNFAPNNTILEHQTIAFSGDNVAVNGVENVRVEMFSNKNIADLDVARPVRASTPFPTNAAMTADLVGSTDGMCRTVVDSNSVANGWSVAAGGALRAETVDDRLSSISWSSVLNFSNNTQNVIESEFSNNNSTSTVLMSTTLSSPCHSYSSSSASSFSDSSSSASSLSSSQSSSSSSANEIFGDIDLSLYDFDLLPPASPPNNRLSPTSQQLAPSLPPLSAEELVRSFPANESVPGNGCFKNEFLSEELDHIMHILVGM